MLFITSLFTRVSAGSTKSDTVTVQNRGRFKLVILMHFFALLTISRLQAVQAPVASPAPIAPRAVPTTLDYDGHINAACFDSNGKPVDSCVLDVQFFIYNGTNPLDSELWREPADSSALPVSVNYSNFHVVLGRSVALPEAVFISGEPRYLEVRIGKKVVSQRALISSAFAMKSQSAISAVSAVNSQYLAGRPLSDFQLTLLTPRCPAGQFFNAISASGVVGCAEPPPVDLSGTVFPALNVAGSGKIGTNLYVFGTGAIGSNLTVVGSGKIGSDLTVAGSGKIGTNLNVAGTGAIGSNLTVTGTGTIGSSLQVATSLNTAWGRIRTLPPPSDELCPSVPQNPGIHDCSKMINDEINAAWGGLLIIPPFQYDIYNPIVVNGPVSIQGTSWMTRIVMAVKPGAAYLDNVAILIKTSQRVKISDVRIESRGYQMNPGAGISVCPPELGQGYCFNGLSSFDGIQVTGFYYGFDLANASSWSMSNNYVINNIAYGVFIRGTESLDAADGLIIGNTFNRGQSGVSLPSDVPPPPFGVIPAAIRQESHMARLVSNKILGYEIGYDLAVDACPNSLDPTKNDCPTSNVYLTGNSFEGPDTSLPSVRLGRKNPNLGSVSLIHVTGNELYNGIEVGDGMAMISIMGNTVATNHGTGILVSGGEGTTIEGNTIAGTGGEHTGIHLMPNAYNSVVGNNNFVRVSQPLNNESDTAMISTALNNDLVITSTVKTGGVTAQTGIIMKNEYGKCFRTTVSSTGMLITTALRPYESCP